MKEWSWGHWRSVEEACHYGVVFHRLVHSREYFRFNLSVELAKPAALGSLIPQVSGLDSLYFLFLCLRPGLVVAGAGLVTLSLGVFPCPSLLTQLLVDVPESVLFSLSKEGMADRLELVLWFVIN